MGHRQGDGTVQRVRFRVRDLTYSRVDQEQRRRAEELRVQRLRDIGWDERADEIEQQSEWLRIDSPGERKPLARYVAGIRRQVPQLGDDRQIPPVKHSS